MNKLNLIFGISSHVPPGAPQESFNKKFEKLYLPLVEFSESNPGFKFCLHLSGTEFEWLLKNKKDLFERLKKLVSKRSVEMISGGIFEPLFSLIPERDMISQLNAYSDWQKKSFGFKPAGAWVRGSIWEHRFAKILSVAEIEYTVLDEKLFEAANIPQKDMRGYYVTENEGKTLKVFPNISSLADILECGGYGEFISRLKDLAGDERPITVFIDPGSQELQAVLSALKENENLILFKTFSDYLEYGRQEGRVYLSSDLNQLMSSFLEYPELNDLHKKMIFVSSMVDAAKGRAVFGGDGERKKIIDRAESELWKGQNFLSYTKDGFSEKNLREAAFGHLINSENLIEKLNRGSAKYADFSHTDIDKDGESEAILSNEIMNLYFSRSRGTLFELDYKPRAINIMSTFEDPAAGENGIRRGSLVDHVLPPDEDINDVEAVKWPVEKSFGLNAQRKANEASVILSSNAEKDGRKIRLVKTIGILAGQSIVNITYEFDNAGEEEINIRFLSEFNLSFPPDIRSGYIMSGNGEKFSPSGEKQISGKTLKLVDEKYGFSVSFDMFDNVSFYSLPVFTRSGAGEKLFQGVRIIPGWQVNIKPKGKSVYNMALRIED